MRRMILGGDVLLALASGIIGGLLDGERQRVAPVELARWEDDGGMPASDDGKPFTNYIAPVYVSRQQRRHLLRRQGKRSYREPMK